MRYSLDDTIAAIATPIGEGAIGIVKLSGPEAPAILAKLFKPGSGHSSPRPFQLRYGRVTHPQTGEVIDEALAVYMRAPHSYTRQDVVEIHTHGGVVPLRRVLQLVLETGARLAEPGEMTLRAFINGRLDLTQAEAVLDVVRAKTEAALRVAADQLQGRLSVRVRQVRGALMDTLAYLEACTDFVEDDIPEQDVHGPLLASRKQVQALLESADRGLIYRQGLRAAIVGRPNVGKSSLLNALLRGERAIVTPIPGTTRDTLEEMANLHGIPLVLVDTAGIRQETDDEVERIGVQRSQAALTRADIVLLVVDTSERLQDADYQIAALTHGKPTIVVLNKSDLPAAARADDLRPDAPRVFLSALTGAGLEGLEEAIEQTVLGGQVTASEVPMVSNPRHQALLRAAVEYLDSALAAYEAELPLDMVSIDARGAIEALGEITGETVTEDLLNNIFSNFCIGK